MYPVCGSGECKGLVNVRYVTTKGMSIPHNEGGTFGYFCGMSSNWIKIQTKRSSNESCRL